MSVKEVKPVKFCPLSLSYIVRLFRFNYFRRFCHTERGIKSLRLQVTCIDLHWSLFCGRIWPFLLLPGRTCRTWTILWTARLLSKSDQGMATPELMELNNDDDVVDIINCYFGGARSKGFATLRNVSKLHFFWQDWASKVCRFSVLFGYLTKWEPN